MKVRRNVRAIVYDFVSGNPCFLLLFARKGYWQFPQGGVEDGEDLAFAASRELEEETGLIAQEVDLKSRFDIEYDAVRRGEKIHVILTAFAVKVDSNFAIRFGLSEDRHQDFRWVNFEGVVSLLTKYPEQLKVFREVCQRMGFSKRGVL